MTKDYEYEMSKAEAILNEAKQSKDDNIQIYYDLYDEIGNLKLTVEDKDLFRTRLDTILGESLR